jgi:predicted metal-dependent HD superfamily phosphohydrolase
LTLTARPAAVGPGACDSGGMDALRGRWGSDVARAVPGVDAQAAAVVGEDLLRRWREPHRCYHDVAHLAEVLAAVDTLARAERVGPRGHAAALLGAWFHDAVYAVDGPTGNEQRSAELASESLGRLGAPGGLVDRVVTLVLDTATHDLGGRVRDPARVLLHDADLWVLAAPVGRFDEYCRQVREEYATVPAATYGRARSEVLRPFLSRGHVYRTGYARSEWEPAARENLARELTRLAA